MKGVLSAQEPLKKKNLSALRADFPALHQKVHGKPLVYLDNAATTQKPECVLRELDRFFREDNANVHRGLHALSERATAAYENARARIARFIHAREAHEIVFTRGTTEAVNLVAQTFGRKFLEEGDEILVTYMEHHSNLVPWQLLCAEKKAHLKVAPVNDRGELLIEEWKRHLTPKTKLAAFTHVSNALGTVNPAEELIRAAHAVGAKVLVDGAQALAHLPVDVQKLDCDFYAASAHKVYGPTGIGFLYGKKNLLEKLPPWQGGGEMITSVSIGRSFFKDPPYRFEAGTPAIAEAVAFAKALDYLEAVGWEELSAHETEVLRYAEKRLLEIPGIRLLGTAREKVAVLSFVHEDIHPHDLGTLMDREGVAVRAGHHCAQPLMERFDIPATTRASFALYNTLGDADALAYAVQRAVEVFQ